MTFTRVPAGKKRCTARNPKCHAPGEWTYGDAPDLPRWCLVHMLGHVDRDVQHQRRTAFVDGEFTFLRPEFCGGILSCRGVACRPGCDERCQALAAAEVVA